MASVPASVCILLAYTWTRHPAFPCADNFPMVDPRCIIQIVQLVSNMQNIEGIFMNSMIYAIFIISFIICYFKKYIKSSPFFLSIYKIIWKDHHKYSLTFTQISPLKQLTILMSTILMSKTECFFFLLLS